MSQPGLPPPKITPTSTSGTEAAKDPDPSEEWLKPNAEASKLFTLKKREGAKVNSKAWLFFRVATGVKDNIDSSDLPDNWSANSVLACCNSCGKLIKVGTRNKKGEPNEWRNTPMTNHLKSGDHSTSIEVLLHETNPDPKKRKFQPQGSIAGFLKKTDDCFVPPKLRQAHQELMTTKFIVDTHQPLSVVENKAFREMIKSHNQHAKPMSNIKVKNIVIELEHAMREAGIEKMKGLSVSFTLDHWTSKANQNCTGFTVHFLDDDWKMISMTLGIILHEGGTTSDELVSSFIDLHFKQLKTAVAVVFAGTTDTTANMNKFGMKLEDLGICHIYCTDHVLQLTCKLCYEKAMSNTFGDQFVVSVKKARDIVKFFNSSTQAKEKLLKKQALLDSCKGKPKGVVVDVVTRWWCCYLMIERLIVIKPAIDAMKIDNQLGGHEPLEPEDWQNLEVIKKVLKPFMDAMKMLEGDSYVTASWVPQAIKKIRAKLQEFSVEEEETASKVLATSLLKDFEERWSVNGRTFNDTVQRGRKNRQEGIHPALQIATFLDPRFKTLVSIPDEESRTAIQKRVLVLMKESETKHCENTAVAPAPMEVEEEAKEEDGDDDDDDDFFAGLEEEVAAAEAGNQDIGLESVDIACEDEMKRYLNAKSLKHFDAPDKKGNKVFNDPLKWWRDHEALYPVLARLAKIYLPVQASSAPSERVFSVASRVISSTQAGLDPAMAGKLLCVSENWEWWESELDFDKLAFGAKE